MGFSETAGDEDTKEESDPYRSGQLLGIKAPLVREYLDSKPGRFVERFIPTRSSWANMVDRWFGESAAARRIRRESWKSVEELERAMTEYIQHWSDSGKHFTWRKGYEEVKRRTAEAPADHITFSRKMGHCDVQNIPELAQVIAAF